MNKAVRILFVSVIFVFVALPAYAVPFTNGDFASGLDGWSDASSNGSISHSGGAAQLSTGAGDDPFSSILVQGDDGFFNFNSPVTLESDNLFLNFDVQFMDLGQDLLEAGASFFTDSLVVAVYDSVNFLDDLIFNTGVDASSGNDWQRIHVDVSSLIGHDVALSFELGDQDDGRDSQVLLDNISFTRTPDIPVIAVPEPNTVFLLIIGVLLITTMRKQLGY